MVEVFFQKKSKILLPLLGFLLCVYLTLRAVYPAITCDEVFSYNYYVPATWSNIYWYNVKIDNYWIPNNHLLNSWAMKASVYLFGVKDWVLRLPNVVLAIFAVIFSIKLLKKITNFVTWQIFGFVLLFANQYYLEFFAMARGYGMMHSFVVISFYYLYRYITDANTLFYLFATLLMGFAAAFANFIGINYFFSIACVLSLFILLENKMQWRVKAIHISIIIGIGLLLLAWIYPPLKKVLATGHAYGGYDNFWKDTFYSLIKNYLFEQKSEILWLNQTIFWFLFCGILSIAVLSIVYQIYTIWLQRSLVFLKKPLSIFWILGLLMVAVPIVQHRFGSTFLLNRTALIYVPLWGIALFLYLKTVLPVANFYIKRGVWLVTVCLLLHTFSQMNLSFVYEYPGDSYTKTVLHDINTFYTKKYNLTENVTVSKNILKLGAFRYTQPAFRFYSSTLSDYKNKIYVPDYQQEVQIADSCLFYFIVAEADSSHLVRDYKLFKTYSKGFYLYKKKDF